MVFNYFLLERYKLYILLECYYGTIKNIFYNIKFKTICIKKKLRIIYSNKEIKLYFISYN